MRARIDELQRQQEELTALRAYLQTDDYVEGVARRVLGLVRPGERLYVIESDAAPTPAGTPVVDGETGSKSWWEHLYIP